MSTDWSFFIRSDEIINDDLIHRWLRQVHTGRMNYEIIRVPIQGMNMNLAVVRVAFDQTIRPTGLVQIFRNMNITVRDVFSQSEGTTGHLEALGSCSPAA